MSSRVVSPGMCRPHCTPNWQVVVQHLQAQGGRRSGADWCCRGTEEGQEAVTLCTEKQGWGVGSLVVHSLLHIEAHVHEPGCMMALRCQTWLVVLRAPPFRSAMIQEPLGALRLLTLASCPAETLSSPYPDRSVSHHRLSHQRPPS